VPDLPRNRTRSRARVSGVNAPLTASAGVRTLPRSLATLSDDDREALVASAQTLFGSARESYASTYKSWQDELWEYSRTIGEYGSVMDWFASGFSRHHLVAAVQRFDDQLREPEIITEGPAAALVNDLVVNARGGETQYLFKWGRQLTIPGVAYFIAEDNVRAGGRRTYDVKSVKQVRRSTKPLYGDDGRVLKTSWGEPIAGHDVLIEPNRWRPLGRSSLVGRIFRPDDEYDFEVTSWSRHALTTLREIDLYNRHIVATLLSRLVFNGILFIPEEVTFPVNPQFKDAPDPFIAELLAIASRGIKDPGSPASAIPLPLRVKSEFIERFKHLIIATGVDPKVIQARTSAIQRLVRQLPAPPEASEGKSNLNQWNAWADSADNVKFYFGPTFEILAGGLTELFLWPMLEAAGESTFTSDGAGQYVIWYDGSDLVSQPDNSANAEAARGRNAISDEAYLKVVGLDAADVPTEDELKKQILTGLATQGLPTPDSFYKRFPDEKPPEQAAEAAGALAEATARGQAAGQPQPQLAEQPAERAETAEPRDGDKNSTSGAPAGAPGPSPKGAPGVEPSDSSVKKARSRSSAASKAAG
jgi:hypothetical protein